MISGEHTCERCGGTGWVMIKREDRDVAQRCDCQADDIYITRGEKDNIPPRFLGFDLRGYMPQEENAVGDDDLRFVDEALSSWRGRTEIPREFVVPGESRLGAQLDVSRSVVRRAERSLVAAGYAERHPHAVRVVNRISDILFVVARGSDGKVRTSKGL